MGMMLHRHTLAEQSVETADDSLNLDIDIKDDNDTKTDSKAKRGRPTKDKGEDE